MKNSVVTILFTLIFNSGFCQEKIFFEKNAFEFYKKSILKKSKSRIKLNKKLEQGAVNPFWFPRCEKEIKIIEVDTVFDNRLIQIELPYITDKQFKVKNSFKNTEYVCLDKAILINKNIVLVNINEIYKHHGIYYHIFLDMNGNILRYCQGGYIE